MSDLARVKSYFISIRRAESGAGGGWGWAGLKRLQPARRAFSICQSRGCQLCSCWMLPFPMISPIDFLSSAHRELDQTSCSSPKKGATHCWATAGTDLSPCCSGKRAKRDGSGAGTAHASCCQMPWERKWRIHQVLPSSHLGYGKGIVRTRLLFPCVWEARHRTRYGPLLLALACWPWSGPEWGATLHEKGAVPGSQWPEGFTWPRVWGQYKSLEERCSNNASSAFTETQKPFTRRGKKEKKKKHKEKKKACIYSQGRKSVCAIKHPLKGKGLVCHNAPFAGGFSPSMILWLVPQRPCFAYQCNWHGLHAFDGVLAAPQQFCWMILWDLWVCKAPIFLTDLPLWLACHAIYTN